MLTYICFLRGINVGGKNPIKMADLKDIFTTLGFKNVQTYIQSGNIVFQAKKTSLLSLEQKISKRIVADFGFEIQVMVKDISEIKEIVKGNPFVENKSLDQSKLHVTFLSEIPDVEQIIKISEGDYGDDEMICIHKSIYLYCPHGYGNTKLTNGFFEKKLKLYATTRNWKTTNHLLEIAQLIEA